MGRQQAWCQEARIGGVWTVCRSGIDGQLCSDHPKAMTQRGNDVSNICRFVPKLTVNGQFMRDFMAEESPCFALGLVEERKQPCGFLALRPAAVIPPEISGLGFNFGHALLGTTEFEVIQFVFHFYGFETYNVLVNPNNRLVKKVLMRMVESGDYFFFAISPQPERHCVPIRNWAKKFGWAKHQPLTNSRINNDGCPIPESAGAISETS